VSTVGLSCRRSQAIRRERRSRSCARYNDTRTAAVGGCGGWGYSPVCAAGIFGPRLLQALHVPVGCSSWLLSRIARLEHMECNKHTCRLALSATA
jgi:hypothetical protein